MTRATCELPPDPSDVMRKLQAIAVRRPELADTMKEAVALISKETALLIDFKRTWEASRFPEIFG